MDEWTNKQTIGKFQFWKAITILSKTITYIFSATLQQVTLLLVTLYTTSIFDCAAVQNWNPSPEARNWKREPEYHFTEVTCSRLTDTEATLILDAGKEQALDKDSFTGC